MTLEAMIVKLRQEHAALGTTIKVLEARLQTPATAAKLVAHVRASKAKPTPKPKSRAYAPGTHWTQRPENKARLRAIRARQRR